MLSILIPVFNFDISILVNALHQQGIACAVPFEIRVIDDNSEDSYKVINRSISDLTQVYYEELPKNIGRSAIRNLLAKKAGFDYLLFMDCDSKVVKQGYLNTYLHHLDPSSLLYGGRSYSLLPPENFKYMLHWQFGSKREVKKASERNANPYESFMSNNFLIPKSIFLSVQFDERLLQYGHEDTLFGMELKKRNIPILHLDNPLEHIGLEYVDQFLKKTNQSIENLWQLHINGNTLPTKLMQTYLRLEQFQAVFLTKQILKRLRPLILQKLHGQTPNLKYLDLYKLDKLLTVSTP